MFFAAAAHCVVAQSPPSGASNPEKKRRLNIYHHLGSVEVPDGFTGYVGANWNDAWAGSIDAPSGGISIDWRAGLIEYVVEKRKKDVISQEVDRTAGFPIDFSRLRDTRGNTLVAKIGWLEFSSLVRTEKEEATFLAIVRSFQKEKCLTCRSLPFKIQE